MFIDAREIPPNSQLDCDVVIVGAGAGGIPLACEFANTGWNVILLEAGGKRTDRETQDLYRGEVTDPLHHGPLDHYRRRCFGGTSTVWGGRCAPFDEIDFQRRAHVPDSGWPICRSDLDPYYRRAHAYCHAGEYEYDVSSALPGKPPEMIPGLRSKDVSQDRIWRFSLPTNMAKSFGGVLEQSPRVRVLFHANCLRILTSESGTAVAALKVASLQRNEFSVRARFYVLSAGGLEVTRLLLVSDDVHRHGIGNDHDFLGRFYGSHITGELGAVTLTPRGGPLIWDYEMTRDGVYCRRTLSIRPETQRREGLMNFRCGLFPPPIADPAHRNAILSSVYLIKRFLIHRIPPEYSKDLAAMTPYKRVLEHARNVVLGAPQLAAFSFGWVNKRILSERKLPSVMLENRANVYNLHFDAEQSPNRESRVMLSEQVDALGVRRLRVDWRFREADAQSVVRSFEILRRDLHDSGVGVTHSSAEELSGALMSGSGVGSHHYGTTRMSADPKAGVVDEHCRVHGVENLFVASSSVCPTTSFANPTLTIVALNLRVADRVKHLLQHT
ncbi:MAG TPA: GMC family oxidoreductase [Verrucomicrobiae bacterium]|nr:GMC family oxidoreductase [Verrucomicrobiae bacterium]